MVQGSGFRVPGVGSMGWGLGFWVLDLNAEVDGFGLPDGDASIAKVDCNRVGDVEILHANVNMMTFESTDFDVDGRLSRQQVTLQSTSCKTVRG